MRSTVAVTPIYGVPDDLGWAGRPAAGTNPTGGLAT